MKQSIGGSTRLSPGTKAGAKNRLARFLADPRRPADTLSYHELQGFLFAIASAPEMVRPSEWMPEIYAGHDAGFESLEEAQAILPELMALYNVVNAPIVSGRATLPADCRFRRTVMTNFDADAPISLWSRGFARGHGWLEEDWDAWDPEEFDPDFGMKILTLSFFAKRSLAEKFVKELGRTDLEETASLIRRAFPHALADYARLGRSIHTVLMERASSPPPRTHTKIGRNDPCPCGSGLKYKKCCGAAPAH